MSAELAVPLAVVCRVLEAPRSTIYARRAQGGAPAGPGKRGPKTRIGDEDLVALIRTVIAESSFAGEGHRKVRARLRRQHDVRVGRHRVLRLMRREGLLAPQRAARRRRPRPHDGTIIPDRPDVLWGVDATMAHTVADGWVWVFVCVDHYSAEAWASVAVRGDRFAALEPLYDAVRDHFGPVGPDAARGVACRHDWGPQYTSGHFQGSLRWLGINDTPAFPGEPACNGCAERFIRTLKEQCIWTRHHHDVADLRAAVAEFVERYNTEWLIERHDHATPREAYRAAIAARAA